MIYHYINVKKTRLYQLNIDDVLVSLQFASSKLLMRYSLDFIWQLACLVSCRLVGPCGYYNLYHPLVPNYRATKVLTLVCSLLQDFAF